MIVEVGTANGDDQQTTGRRSSMLGLTASSATLLSSLLLPPMLAPNPAQAKGQGKNPFKKDLTKRGRPDPSRYTEGPEGLKYLDIELGTVRTSKEQKDKT